MGGLCSSSSFERVRGNDFVGEIKELERIQRTNGNLPDSSYRGCRLDQCWITAHKIQNNAKEGFILLETL